MDSILRIDMGAAGGPAASLAPAGRYAGLAGRAITSLVVAEEVDPSGHPLGGGNKLVVAPGAGRAVSVGCKSPLDGGIVASRADGPAADALRRLGYAAVVVEGQAGGDDLWTVVVDARGVFFAAENGYRMLGNLETVAKLRRAHGEGAALLSIGPAGEMGLGAASLTCTVGGPRPTRHCGLGGAGAVMASKHLKAIVVRGGPAEEPAPPSGPETDAAGSPFRAACGIRDPLVLGQLEALEDDLGLDAGEVAAAVSLAMEAGLARLGDGQAALRLVEEIARGTPLGRLVGSGVRVMADAFGLERRLARAERVASGPDAGLRAAAEAELGPAARHVLDAERRFEERAHAAAEEHGAGDVEPAVSVHPIVFGAIDDDLARLFGVLDADADPFDPQLPLAQLPIGLRRSHPAAAGRPAVPARTLGPLSRKN